MVVAEKDHYYLDLVLVFVGPMPPLNSGDCVVLGSLHNSPALQHQIPRNYH